MNEKFYNEVKDEVSKIFNEQGENLDVQIQKVVKANNVIYHGLTIKGNTNITPVIYLEQFCCHDDSCLSVQECAKKVIEIYMSNHLEKDFDINSITDYEKVKDKIIVCLYNTEANAKSLLDMPHKNYEDLSIYYRIDIPMNDDSTGSVILTNKLMSAWNKNVEEIDRIAWDNMKRINPPTFMSMNTVISEMIGAEEMLEITEESQMYVFSCKNKQNGAVYMLDTQELMNICDILNDDLCILPSSRHEVIILPARFANKNDDYTHLKEIVREVNETQLEKEDFLSNNIYLFERAIGKLKMVA